MSDAKLITVRVDGWPLGVPAGITVAAAVERASAGRGARVSPGGQRRQPFCGMGVCGECRVSIDGRAQRLGCQTACVAGMEIRTDG